MAFDRTNFARTTDSATENVVPVGWSYISSADDVATISASAYFNDASDVLSQYDYIYIRGSDASDWIAISSVTGATPVTVVAF